MVITTRLRQDLRQLVRAVPLDGDFFSGDVNANRIEVEITDGGQPAALTGNVFGYAIRSDDVTVPVNGELNGNIASVVLPASAYTVVGLLSVVVKVGTTTVAACTTHVYCTDTGEIVDPGEVVPSLAELLAKIAECEDATADANQAAADARQAVEDMPDLDAMEDELNRRIRAVAVKKATDGPESVVHIYDGADLLPVQEMVIDIRPMQDLHGYDCPWVGGTGKNILPMSANLPITIQGVEWTIRDDGAIVATRKNTSSNNSDLTYAYITLQAGSYIFSCFDAESSPGGSTYQANCKTDGTNHWGIGITNISSETETIVEIVLRVYPGFTGTAIFKPMIRLSSETDAVFTPYSNICPISGWNAAKINRTGKNLLTLSGTAWQNGTGLPVSDLYAVSSCDLIQTSPGEKFTYYRNIATETNQSLVMRRYDANKKCIGNGEAMNSTLYGPKTVTIPDNTYYVAFTRYGASRTEGLQVQVEKGDIFTGYEEPAQQTVEVSFAEAGTVYDGTLTIHQDGSGELVIDYVSKELSNNWSFDAASHRFYQPNMVMNPPVIMVNGPRLIKFICDKFNAITDGREYSQCINGDCYFGAPSDATHAALYIHADNINSVEEFIEKVGTITIVYETSAKTPILLTASQITTLLGTNNIWANCGDILSLAYPVDSKTHISEVKNILERHTSAVEIRKTVSDPSDVMAINDGADDITVDELVVGIEPVQDLHGYDNPWPAGGGKNKIDISSSTVGKMINSSGATYNAEYGSASDYIPVSEGPYVFSAKSGFSTAVTRRIYGYNSQKGTVDTVGYLNSAIEAGTSYSIAITVPSGVSFVRIGYATDDTNVQLESGSTATAYVPYSNICPISGWTECNIVRAGKNLCEYSIYSCNLDGTGKIVSGASSDYSLFVAKVKKGVTYSATKQDANLVAGFFITAPGVGSVTYDNSRSVQANYSTFTAPIDGYVAVRSIKDDTDVQIEIGSEVTNYETHQDKFYQIAFPSSAGTVYGGTLTIHKDGTGTLNVEKVVHTLSASEIVGLQKIGDEYGCYAEIDTLVRMADYSNDIKCNTLPTIINHVVMVNEQQQGITGYYNTISYLGQNWLYIYLNGFSTLQQYRDWVTANPPTVVYTVAEPTQYGISASQIATLLGTNNIWADTGDIRKIVYTADTKLYVDGLVNQSVIPEIGRKADKSDTVLETTLSRGRKADTDVGLGSFAFGANVTASNMVAHAEGNQTTASGLNSHAEGSNSTASGTTSHAEGLRSTASGEYSHAEGNVATASGYTSHAEGSYTNASNYYAHAEGNGSVASGIGSHAEGTGTAVGSAMQYTNATGDGSHAEGLGTLASNAGSHSEGARTTASGRFSHAEGWVTEANHRAQHVFGEYNVIDSSSAAVTARGTYVEIVGNGNSSTRSNARTLDWNGNEALAGSLTLGKGTENEVTITAAQLTALLALLN